MALDVQLLETRCKALGYEFKMIGPGTAAVRALPGDPETWFGTNKHGDAVFIGGPGRTWMTDILNPRLTIDDVWMFLSKPDSKWTLEVCNDPDGFFLRWADSQLSPVWAMIFVSRGGVPGAPDYFVIDGRSPVGPASPLELLAAQRAVDRLLIMLAEVQP